MRLEACGMRHEHKQCLTHAYRIHTHTYMQRRTAWLPSLSHSIAVLIKSTPSSVCSSSVQQFHSFAIRSRCSVLILIGYLHIILVVVVVIVVGRTHTRVATHTLLVVCVCHSYGRMRVRDGSGDDIINEAPSSWSEAGPREHTKFFKRDNRTFIVLWK